METNSEKNAPGREVLEQLLAGVTALEGALADAELRVQKYAGESELLRQTQEQQAAASS